MFSLFLIIQVIVALPLAVVASSRPTDDSAQVSNARTSLTLVYSNNLNATDDVHHMGAMVLDPIGGESAARFCESVNEKLLSQDAIRSHADDIAQSLITLDYNHRTGSSYHIRSGVLTLSGHKLKFKPGKSAKHLPVLCTQSSHTSQLQSPADAASHLVKVHAAGNTYVGYRDLKSFRFTGVRYADKPGRFVHSKPYSGRGATLNATTLGAQCLQRTGGSEDCLFLNVYTPFIPREKAPSEKRAVLFWIHGGGLSSGTGADPEFDGGNLASREDVVVVTINYRLSTLGFLAIPGSPVSGNFGTGDQITALKWVADHISSFGGDPDRVTIAGSSAGAGSIRVLLGSPSAAGLFHGAIANSAPGGGANLGVDTNFGSDYSFYLTMEDYYARDGIPLLESVNCTANGATSRQIECLRAVNASALVNAKQPTSSVVQDGIIINTPELVITSRDPPAPRVPIMFGIVENDGASLATYPKTPGANLSQTLQTGLGIDTANAQNIIDSGLFPLHDTGNLTLDAFNVTQRVNTDNTFRCVDQATVFAAASSRSAFSAAYYYQFNRSFRGFDPNKLPSRLIQGPVSPAYPNGDPDGPYFRLHGSAHPWIFGNPIGGGIFRDDGDLWSLQLASSYMGAFVRNGAPKLDIHELELRGPSYSQVRKAVLQNGQWLPVGATKYPVRLLDWPSTSSGFVDVEQCEWLGYGLEYYL